MANGRHRLLVGLLSLVGCGARVEILESIADRSPTVDGRVVLNEDALDHLGIKTASVQQKTIQLTRTLPGWLEVCPTSEVVIRAPVTGFMLKSADAAWPEIGIAVPSDSIMATVNVFLSPQELSQLVHTKEDTDTQIAQSLVSMHLAEDQLKLVSAASDAVSGIRIKELKETFERSKAAHKEAIEKLPYLIREPSEGGFLLKPVSVENPKAGRVSQAHVSPKQFVQAGEALWTVTDWSSLWLRVPVFEDDLSQFRRDSSIRVFSGGDSLVATPITAPMPTKPGLRTIDLYFSLTNPDWKLRAGQVVNAALPLNGEATALVIPRTAVLYDEFGRTFVYIREKESISFRRRQIELGSRQGNDIVVARGLDADDTVVSVGAETVYAEEFKGTLSTGDDE